MWWISVVMEESDSGCFVKDMYSEGPSHHCLCWVEMESMLKVIQPPATGMGHQYTFHERTQATITNLFSEKLRIRYSLNKRCTTVVNHSSAGD
jgi:hypothetical protein